MNGMFLFLRGKCQPKQWRQEEWEIKINSIELLPEVKEKIIEKLTVTAPLSAIDEEMIEEFTALVKANPVMRNFISTYRMKMDRCMSI